MDPYLTEAQLENLDARTWGIGHKADVTPAEAYLLIKEVRRLRGENSMLTDSVVTAAALWFNQMGGPMGEYASEALHETAAELVKKNPRLKGAFRPEV